MQLRQYSSWNIWTKRERKNKAPADFLQNGSNIRREMFEQKEKEKSKAPPDFSQNIEKTPQRNSKIWLAVFEWVIEILVMEQCYIWA